MYYVLWPQPFECYDRSHYWEGDFNSWKASNIDLHTHLSILRFGAQVNNIKQELQRTLVQFFISITYKCSICVSITAKSYLSIMKNYFLILKADTNLWKDCECVNSKSNIFEEIFNKFHFILQNCVRHKYSQGFWNGNKRS